jgi:hypothetical protein
MDYPDLERSKEEQAREEIERQRYEKVMATKDGRWVLWQILSELNFRGTVYGERHAGKHEGAVIISDTLRNHNIDLYHQMIVENDR